MAAGGGVAALAGAATLVLRGADPAQDFFLGYLLAYLFWTGIAAGSLGLLMLHHLTGGGWGDSLRPVLRASSGTLSLMGLLFLPLVAGLPDLYPWASSGKAAHPGFREEWLTPGFFGLRAAVCFAVWIGLAILFNRAPEPFARRWSGPGLVLYGITATMASFDWAMSLEPEWASTMYGLQFISGQVLSALGLAVLVAAGRSAPERRRDLGNLLLAFVLVWAYLAYSQYLILWSGNLPEETPWVLRRTAGGWQGFALLLVVAHFLVPFLLLLSRRAKESGGMLALVAGLLLGMRAIELCWLVVPALRARSMDVPWLSVPSFLAVGGLWAVVAGRRWGARLGGAS
jgi:hypothetical protein